MMVIRKRNPMRLIITLFLIMPVINGTAFADDIPLMKLQEVTDLIMSPGCDYIYTLSLCPSSEAAQMKEMVKDKLAQGESKEQILAYFERVYGPRVLARPAKRGFYFVAWWFPYFLMADAFVIVGVILYVWRRRSRKRDNTAPRGDDTVVDRELDSILESEVRKAKGN
jgi:cytochrome c-type biogenesis protein CcmH